MVVRVLVFAAWAAIGAVATYGFFYILTPFGLMICGTCLFAALALPEPGGGRWPEIIGLAAGPGLFLLLVGSYGDQAAGLAGGAIVTAAALIYVMVGRARCARA